MYQLKMSDNLNTCDKCKVVERSDDLIWISTEDFTPHDGEVLQEGATKKYDAVCEACYQTLLK